MARMRGWLVVIRVPGDTTAVSAAFIASDTFILIDGSTGRGRQGGNSRSTAPPPTPQKNYAGFGTFLAVIFFLQNKFPACKHGTIFWRLNRHRMTKSHLSSIVTPSKMMQLLIFAFSPILHCRPITENLSVPCTRSTAQKKKKDNKTKQKTTR